MNLETSLQKAISDRTANGIALAIGRLISSGELEVGVRLPTVRAVAGVLDVSPTTVSEAWRILRGHGAIATDGRRGTFVRGTRQGVAPGRYWRVPVDPGTFSVDLSTGTPDPALLPPLGPVLREAPLDLPVMSYLDEPVLPELDALLRSDWPFPPELLTIVDGAQDGLDRLVAALVTVGDTVLVGDPEFPPLLDMLDQAGARVIGLPLDHEGIDPIELERHLAAEPVALFVQPRAHNPTGINMSVRRARSLAAVVKGHPLTVVEDDHSGPIGGPELTSLGAHIPSQVVHIRSFSKSHGPDLRLAAVGGAELPIDTLVRRRRLGPSWSSRLLQQILLTMLTDPGIEADVDRSAAVYAERRAKFVAALDRHGITVDGVAGLNLWIPVADEQVALITLAAHGIGAAPGAPFRVGPTDHQHLRISISTDVDDIDALASTIARAANADPGRR